MAPGVEIDHWCEPTAQLKGSVLTVSVERPEQRALSGPVSGVVRGLLGERLRDLRCLTRATACEGCAEAHRCDYAAAFVHLANRADAHGDREAAPFWLRGLPVTRHVGSAPLEVELVTVGPAHAAIGFFEVALRDALQRLLGPAAAVGVGRVRPLVPLADVPPARRWRLEARTPLSLGGDIERCRADCPEAPWVPALVRAGVRRVKGLLAAHAPELARPHVAYPDLSAISRVEGAWEWWEESRFSHSQKRRVPLSGWVGTLVIEGEQLPRLAPLLSLLTNLGVGKGTVLGLGHLVATPIE